MGAEANSSLTANMTVRRRREVDTTARPRRRVAWLLMAALIASAGYAFAQLPGGVFGGFGGLRGEQGDPAELPPPERPDGNLAGCHMLYTSVRREANGNGWRTDYPWGQRNLLIRLSELTKTRVSRPAGGPPHVWLVRLTDPALFGCAYLMASDVGTIGLSDEEAVRAAALSAEGRLPVGGRLLGRRSLGPVDA